MLENTLTDSQVPTDAPPTQEVGGGDTGGGFKSDVFKALKETYGKDGFTLSDKEFYSAIDKDPEYRTQVYVALKDGLEGFELSDQEFYSALGYGDSNPPSVGASNAPNASTAAQKSPVAPLSQYVLNAYKEDDLPDGFETSDKFKEIFNGYDPKNGSKYGVVTATLKQLHHKLNAPSLLRNDKEIANLRYAAIDAMLKIRQGEISERGSKLYTENEESLNNFANLSDKVSKFELEFKKINSQLSKFKSANISGEDLSALKTIDVKYKDLFNQFKDVDDVYSTLEKELAPIGERLKREEVQGIPDILIPTHNQEAEAFMTRFQNELVPAQEKRNEFIKQFDDLQKERSLIVDKYPDLKNPQYNNLTKRARDLYAEYSSSHKELSSMYSQYGDIASEIANATPEINKLEKWRETAYRAYGIDKQKARQEDIEKTFNEATGVEKVALGAVSLMSRFATIVGNTAKSIASAPTSALNAVGIEKPPSIIANQIRWVSDLMDLAFTDDKPAYNVNDKYSPSTGQPIYNYQPFRRVNEKTGEVEGLTKMGILQEGFGQIGLIITAAGTTGAIMKATGMTEAVSMGNALKTAVQAKTAAERGVIALEYGKTLGISMGVMGAISFPQYYNEGVVRYGDTTFANLYGIQMAGLEGALETILPDVNLVKSVTSKMPIANLYKAWKEGGKKAMLKVLGEESMKIVAENAEEIGAQGADILVSKLGNALNVEGAEDLRSIPEWKWNETFQTAGIVSTSVAILGLPGMYGNIKSTRPGSFDSSRARALSELASRFDIKDPNGDVRIGLESLLGTGHATQEDVGRLTAEIAAVKEIQNSGYLNRLGVGQKGKEVIAMLKAEAQIEHARFMGIGNEKAAQKFISEAEQKIADIIQNKNFESEQIEKERKDSEEADKIREEANTVVRNEQLDRGAGLPMSTHAIGATVEYQGEVGTLEMSDTNRVVFKPNDSSKADIELSVDDHTTATALESGVTILNGVADLATQNNLDVVLVDVPETGIDTGRAKPYFINVRTGDKENPDMNTRVYSKSSSGNLVEVRDEAVRKRVISKYLNIQEAAAKEKADKAAQEVITDTTDEAIADIKTPEYLHSKEDVNKMSHAQYSKAFDLLTKSVGKIVSDLKSGATTIAKVQATYKAFGVDAEYIPTVIRKAAQEASTDAVTEGVSDGTPNETPSGVKPAPVKQRTPVLGKSIVMPEAVTTLKSESDTKKLKDRATKGSFIHTSLSAVAKMQTALNKLFQGQGKVKFTVFWSKLDFDEFTDTLHLPTGKSFWDPTTNTVYLDSESLVSLDKFHEAIHPVVRAYFSTADGQAKMDKFAADIENDAATELAAFNESAPYKLTMQDVLDVTSKYWEAAGGVSMHSGLESVNPAVYLFLTTNGSLAAFSKAWMNFYVDMANAGKIKGQSARMILEEGVTEYTTRIIDSLQKSGMGNQSSAKTLFNNFTTLLNKIGLSRKDLDIPTTAGFDVFKAESLSGFAKGLAQAMLSGNIVDSGTGSYVPVSNKSTDEEEPMLSLRASKEEVAEKVKNLSDKDVFRLLLGLKNGFLVHRSISGEFRDDYTDRQYYSLSLDYSKPFGSNTKSFVIPSDKVLNLNKYNREYQAQTAGKGSFVRYFTGNLFSISAYEYEYSGKDSYKIPVGTYARAIGKEAAEKIKDNLAKYDAHMAFDAGSKDVVVSLKDTSILKEPREALVEAIVSGDLTPNKMAEAISIVDESPMQSLRLNEGFYSPLEKSISESKFDKLPAKQWLDKFGKTEEAKWNGLADWLSTQKGSVSKIEIQNFLEENRFEVVEVVNEQDTKIDVNSLTVEQTSRGNWDVFSTDKPDNGNNILYRTVDKSEASTAEEAKQIIADEVNEEGEDRTKYSEHQLEGKKENYKEVLVTMPSKEGKNPLHEKRDSLSKQYSDAMVSGEYDLAFQIDSQISQITEQLKSENSINKTGEKAKFISSHFSEPNILVHLRMNTRESNGQKVLFLEEIQSDWGQKGKKEGFNIPAKKNEFRKEKQTDGSWVVRDANNTAWWHGSTEERADAVINDYNTTETRIPKEVGAVPAAPFVTETPQWVKLGLKVAMKEAVKQGVDKIAWTTGEQQNDRYDLSNSVDWIQKVVDKTNEDRSYIDISTPSTITTLIVDNRINKGKILEVRNSAMGDVVGKNLSDVIGKDVSERLLAGEDGLKLEGEGLNIGGKGMIGFYGSPKEGKFGIVGEVAKKLFKQEVGTTEIKGEINRNITDNEIFNNSKKISFDKAENIIEDKSAGDKWVYVFENGEPFRIRTSGDLMEVKILNQPLYEVTMRGKSAQHSIEITPEMKSQVETEGLPMFSLRTRELGTKPRILDQFRADQAAITIIQGMSERLYTPQKWADIQSRLDTMTDADLINEIDNGDSATLQDFIANVPQGGNVWVLANMELFNRMYADGNTAAATEIYKNLMVVGTYLGQGLAAYRLLKSSNGHAMATGIRAMVKEYGREITTTQFNSLVTAANRVIYSARAKDTYEREQLALIKSGSVSTFDINHWSALNKRVAEAAKLMNSNIDAMLPKSFWEAADSNVKGNLLTIKSITIGLASNTTNLAKLLRSEISRPAGWVTSKAVSALLKTQPGINKNATKTRVGGIPVLYNAFLISKAAISYIRNDRGKIKDLLATGSSWEYDANSKYDISRNIRPIVSIAHGFKLFHNMAKNDFSKLSAAANINASITYDNNVKYDSVSFSFDPNDNSVEVVISLNGKKVANYKISQFDLLDTLDASTVDQIDTEINNGNYSGTVNGNGLANIPKFSFSEGLISILFSGVASLWTAPVIRGIQMSDQPIREITERARLTEYGKALGFTGSDLDFFVRAPNLFGEMLAKQISEEESLMTFQEHGFLGEQINKVLGGKSKLVGNGAIANAIPGQAGNLWLRGLRRFASSLIVPFKNFPANFLTQSLAFIMWPITAASATLHIRNMQLANNQQDFDLHKQKTINAFSTAIAGLIMSELADALLQSGIVTIAPNPDDDKEKKADRFLGSRKFNYDGFKRWKEEMLRTGEMINTAGEYRNGDTLSSLDGLGIFGMMLSVSSSLSMSNIAGNAKAIVLGREGSSEKLSKAKSGEYNKIDEDASLLDNLYNSIMNISEKSAFVISGVLDNGFAQGTNNLIKAIGEIDQGTQSFLVQKFFTGIVKSVDAGVMIGMNQVSDYNRWNMTKKGTKIISQTPEGKLSAKEIFSFNFNLLLSNYGFSGGTEAFAQSEGLFPALDIWGQKIDYVKGESGTSLVFHMTNPFRVEEATADKETLFLYNLQKSINSAEKMEGMRSLPEIILKETFIPVKTETEGTVSVAVKPEEWGEFNEATGKYMKMRVYQTLAENGWTGIDPFQISQARTNMLEALSKLYKEELTKEQILLNDENSLNSWKNLVNSAKSRLIENPIEGAPELRTQTFEELENK